MKAVASLHRLEILWVISLGTPQNSHMIEEFSFRYWYAWYFVMQATSMEYLPQTLIKEKNKHGLICYIVVTNCSWLFGLTILKLCLINVQVYNNNYLHMHIS